MGRTGEYDGEEFPGQAALWAQAAKIARTSKRGRTALWDLREALRHLPERKLVYGAVSTRHLLEHVGDDRWDRDEAENRMESEGEGVCAVGAYVWWKLVQQGMDPDEAWDSLPVLWDMEYDGTETASFGQRYGLTFSLAWELANRNDDYYEGLSPQARWEKFMVWLDKELGDFQPA